MVADSSEAVARSWLLDWLDAAWLPLLLAGVTLFIYSPSMGSAFVYDAHVEILQEGFITSLANLPAVLSLKVLGMKIMLGDRPGQLLYMMLIAAIWGKEPWGYHVCGIVLHAANVALFYVLLRRLIATEGSALDQLRLRRAHLAAAVVTLLFALHPLAVESVAEVSYSSALLVTFFTLLALLAAMAFRPDNFRTGLPLGILGTLGSLAAVTCKESGLSASLLLIAYWLLFRRREAKGPWLWFLASAVIVTTFFLAARFLLAPPGSETHPFLGGSFAQVFAIQPQLWVFMMGKVMWPGNLSANYTLADLTAPSTVVSFMILAVVVALQAWLAMKSRIGAMGVAIYWLALVAVSNFVPLYHIVADRYYYLPLAGVAMQLLAVLLMLIKAKWSYRLAVTICFCALLPLTFGNLVRQEVFSNNLSLWTDTIRVSPHASSAHLGLGWTYFQDKKTTDAIAEFQKALDIDPNLTEGHYNLALALVENGQPDEAIEQFQKTLELKPGYAEAHYDLGNAYFQKGDIESAIAQYHLALDAKPGYVAAYSNLGNALFQKNKVYESIVAFQTALRIDPNFFDAHYNLGLAYIKNGQIDEAVDEFQEAVRINPFDDSAQKNLGRALALLRQRAGMK